jgi:hypothetical protein
VSPIPNLGKEITAPIIHIYTYREQVIRSHSASHSVLQSRTTTNTMYTYSLAPVVYMCTYLYIQGTGYQITISFTQFVTELNYDYVYIFSCTSSLCDSTTQLASFSGAFSPPSVTSTTGFMYVRFTTDSSVINSGWSASWTSVAPVSYQHTYIHTCAHRH